MINVIANIVGVAIVVGAIATALNNRINKAKAALSRNQRANRHRFNDIAKEIIDINSRLRDGNGMADEAETLANLAIGKVDETNRALAFAIDKIEEIGRDLRGETYAIEFWGGGCYGGFKRNGDPIKVDYDEAVLLTRHEAELIRNKFGTGAIVNRSKTILKNLEDK